jgi:uncharacterized membrane protein YhaH (DUF805 family)
MFMVVGGVQGVAMGHLRVVRGLFVISRLVVFCGLAMVLGRLVVMVRRLHVCPLYSPIWQLPLTIQHVQG